MRQPQQLLSPDEARSEMRTGVLWVVVGIALICIALLSGCDSEDTRTPEEKAHARAAAEANWAERHYWRCMDTHKRVMFEYRLSPQAAHNHCSSEQ